MEKRLGLIAGSGLSPSFLPNQIRKQGYLCVIAAVRGEADAELEQGETAFSWFDVGDAAGILRFFKAHQVSEAVFAGKISPLRIYQTSALGSAVLKLLERGRDRSPETIIPLAMDYFGRRGIRFISPEPFLAPLLCAEGVLSKKKPSASIKSDITWGWEKARALADADIGQCVVVKDKAVVAVEGMEGTDAAIRRGGELAGSGVVVIKRARSHQDQRVDLPAVGMDTLRALSEVQGAALCFEAHKMPFFQKAEALELADRHRIVVLARS